MIDDVLNPPRYRHVAVDSRGIPVRAACNGCPNDGTVAILSADPKLAAAFTAAFLGDDTGISCMKCGSFDITGEHGAARAVHLAQQAEARR